MTARHFIPQTDRALVLALSDTVTRVEISEPAHGLHTAGDRVRIRTITQVVERAANESGEGSR